MKHLRLVIGLLLITLTSTQLQAEEAGWRSPHSVEGATTVDVAQAEALHNQGTPFVDVRSLRLFTRKHIPGAHHLDLKSAYTREALSKIVSTEQAFVLYCSGIKCSRSYRAAELAREWGYTNIYYFRAGVVGWKNAGFAMKFADGSVRPANLSGQ